MNIIRKWRTLRVLKHYPIPFNLWLEVTKHLPLIQARSVSERARIRLLATLFIHKKTFTGAAGLTVTPEMAVTVAAQACVAILHLGLNTYDGWIEVILYPGAFQIKRDVTDENGVVHRQTQGLSGESWSRGPVIFSWQDIKHDSQQPYRGHHVVIHEFAHKLDMLSGRANGMPPLHPDMSLHKWTETLTAAWQGLLRDLAAHKHTYLDPYAATNPAEFFAVLSEYFFTMPEALKQHNDLLFKQLQAYYRQSPPDLEKFHNRQYASAN